MIADIITFSRIVLSLMMLTFPVFSPGFYACYLFAGITDMIDGEISRRLGTSSEFGAKLDTAADFIFVVIALYKLIPEVQLSNGIYIWIGVIALIKIISIISGFVVQKQFVTVHSAANKITGLVLFVMPLTWTMIDVKYSAVVVCVMATFAAIQEGHMIRSKSQTESKNQSDK